MQLAVYKTIVQCKEIARLIRSDGGAAAGPGGRRVLSSITALKKLCNHPKLIFEAIRAGQTAEKVRLTSATHCAADSATHYCQTAEKVQLTSATHYCHTLLTHN